MTKKISDNQSSGMEGEGFFAAYALKINLIPNKCINDFGFDYLCQIKGKKLSKFSSEMTGKFVAVSVRSTTNIKKPVIQIDKSDASLFLSCDFPFILALVHLHPKKGPSVFIKLPTHAFIHQLIEFIYSKHEHKSIATKDCVPISDYQTIINEIQKASSLEQRSKTAFLIKKLYVEKIIPNSKLKIVHNDDQSVSIIKLKYFEDQFDIYSEDSKNVLLDVAFGRPELISHKLKGLPLRADLIEISKDLPGTVMTFSPAFSAGEKIKITVINGNKESHCLFETRYIKTHYGYSHDSGLSLIISHREKHKNRFVHWLKCQIDEKAQKQLFDFPDFCSFLENCIGDAKIIIDDSDLAFSNNNFPELSACGWLVKYLKKIDTDSIIDPKNWLFKLPSEEDLQSLRILSFLYTDLLCLNNYGFILDKTNLDELIEENKNFALPLCMNLNDKGIVVWLNVEGFFLKEPDENLIVGLKINNVNDFEVEIRTNPFPTDQLPEFKICAEWPSIPLYQEKMKQREFKNDDWNVGIMMK